MLTLIVGVDVFRRSLGHDPLVTLHAFFVAPLNSMNGLSEWLLKASPLILIACGLAVGFRANVWNIGAEGQLIIGAIAASGVGAVLRRSRRAALLLPLMLLAGMAAGMAWAAIPAFLRARMNTNEILVTLMLTYIATLLLSWLVHGPWRDPAGFNYPQTALLPAAAMLPSRSTMPTGSTRRSSSRPSSSCVMWIFTERSFLGYKMAVGGAAPLAARYAGFRESAADLDRPAWPAALRRHRRHGGSCRAARPAVAADFAGLRVCSHHRRLHRPAESRSASCLAACLMSLLFLGGEAVADDARPAVRADADCSRASCCSSCSPPISSSSTASAGCGRESLMDLFIANLHRHHHRRDAAGIRRARRARGREIRCSQSRHRRHDADRRGAGVLAWRSQAAAAARRSWPAYSRGPRSSMLFARAGADLPDQPVRCRTGPGDLRFGCVGVHRQRLRQCAD